MMSRRATMTLADFPAAGPEMYFAQGQLGYLARLRGWLGERAAVVDYHTSKSVRLPMVRGADGVLVGYNFYDYVVFIPRAVWRRISSAEKAAFWKTRHRWNSSFTSWVPGRGEVLISGGPALMEALVALRVIRPEAGL